MAKKNIPNTLEVANCDLKTPTWLLCMELRQNN